MAALPSRATVGSVSTRLAPGVYTRRPVSDPKPERSTKSLASFTVAATKAWRDNSNDEALAADYPRQCWGGTHQTLVDGKKDTDHSPGHPSPLSPLSAVSRANWKFNEAG